MKDSSASVRARLLNIAKEQGLSFKLIIIRYLQERLLYRVSQSRYRNKFYLKGGALIYAFSSYTENHSLFTNDFFNDQNRLKMWRAFLNKIGQDKDLSFSEVKETIFSTLKPIWEELENQ